MLRKSNVYFYLLTRNKKSTIYARISVGEEKKARSTSQKVDKEHWDQDTQRVKSSHPQSDTINETLSVIENQVREAENTLRSRHEIVTLDSILELLENEQPTISILDLFYEHNRKMKEKVEVGDVAEATYKKYARIERQVRKFSRQVYSSDDIYVSKMDLDFIENLEHWWKTKQGLSHNTTVKYMKQFRKILLIALRRGYLQNDPMEGWNKSLNEVTPVHLTLDELRRIENKDFGDVGRLEKVRDVFVFGCYTGLAYSDLKKLDREEDFYLDSEGDLWLCQNRTKTNEPANVLILPEARAIYEKYSHLDSELPVISNQKMNAYLKEIADVCEVSKRLTTHVARHTFATTITLGHGMPIESVQKMMGHSDRRSTEHYARVTNHKLTNDFKELRRRIS